jgi:hypothetical protein
MIGNLPVTCVCVWALCFIVMGVITWVVKGGEGLRALERVSSRERKGAERDGTKQSKAVLLLLCRRQRGE